MSTSDEIVEELCRNIVNKVLRNEELHYLIDTLLKACNGPKEEIRNPLFQLLDYENIILSILKTNKYSKILKDEADLCSVILNNFFSLNCQNWKIFTALLKICLEYDFKENNSFIQDVWSKQELIRMPAEVVLLLLNYKPAVIEKHLYNLYCMARKNDDLWESDCFQCWVMWCSKSDKLFIVVSSILNQLLLNMNANSVILMIINKLVTNVMAECEINNRSILSLYPLKYQSLVALLMIEPEFNPYKSIIMGKIISLKNMDCKALLLLLSHFPSWIWMYSTLGKINKQNN